jgi:predicted nucleic acid-binding protein
MESPVIAIYDANILYPAPLRDLFVRIAQTGLVRARWTATIHEEWIRNVLKSKPSLTQERLERTRDMMNQAIRDCLVTGYEDLIETLVLPDADDRHVLAAAICANAEVIVTYNLKDFPDTALLPYAIQAFHPDEFLVGLFQIAPELICDAIKSQRSNLRNPPKSADEHLETLRNQGLTQSVALLRPFAELL